MPTNEFIHATEPSNSPEALDAQWYARFEAIAAFQDYEYLDGDPAVRGEERQKFERGEVENPTLDYPKLATRDWRKTEADLLQLKREILQAGTSLLPPETRHKLEVAKQAYRWRLNEKIAEARMLQAAQEGNTRRFARYSAFMYGRPTADVFGYTLQTIRKRATELSKSERQELRDAAEGLLDSFPGNLPATTVSTLPDTATAQLASQQTFEDLGHLFTLPDTEETFDAERTRAAFEQALQALQAEGWQAVLAPSRTFISVNQETRTVQVPETLTAPLKASELQGLIFHEIGTHVARRDLGERSRLRLLGLGLDRYLAGEEGVATFREQAVSDTVTDFEGLDGHLAISLAVGTDGTPRDFRATYELLRAYYTMDALATGKEVSAAQTEAATKAWNRTVRTFRGTDCKTPGKVFSKDIVYREGNIAVWELVRTNPDEMARFNLGKFNPTNPRHLWILTELGIHEDQLDTLDDSSEIA